MRLFKPGKDKDDKQWNDQLGKIMAEKQDKKDIEESKEEAKSTNNDLLGQLMRLKEDVDESLDSPDDSKEDIMKIED